MENEIAAARTDLQRIVEEKRKVEELERKAKEAESERLAAEKRLEEHLKKSQRDLAMMVLMMTILNVDQIPKELAELKEQLGVGVGGGGIMHADDSIRPARLR